MVLERFLDQDFPTLTRTAQQIFSELLDATDPDLFDWILGRTVPPTDALRVLISRLQAHRPT